MDSAIYRGLHIELIFIYPWKAFSKPSEGSQLDEVGHMSYSDNGTNFIRTANAPFYTRLAAYNNRNLLPKDQMAI